MIVGLAVISVFTLWIEVLGLVSAPSTVWHAAVAVRGKQSGGSGSRLDNSLADPSASDAWHAGGGGGGSGDAGSRLGASILRHAGGGDTCQPERRHILAMRFSTGSLYSLAESN